MKDAIASILQERMDKCTTEQFWATGAITGLYAFLLAEAATISKQLPIWATICASLVVAAYGIYFVLHRHSSYFDMLGALAELLKDEPAAPTFLKSCPNRWKGHSLSGVLFYVGWIVISFVAVLVSYLCPFDNVCKAAECQAGDETVFLVRVEDLRSHSHLAVARSNHGILNWHIDSKPSLVPDPTESGEWKPPA